MRSSMRHWTGGETVVGELRVVRILEKSHSGFCESYTRIRIFPWKFGKFTRERASGIAEFSACIIVAYKYFIVTGESVTSPSNSPIPSSRRIKLRFYEFVAAGACVKSLRSLVAFPRLIRGTSVYTSGTRWGKYRGVSGKFKRGCQTAENAISKQKGKRVESQVADNYYR